MDRSILNSFGSGFFSRNTEYKDPRTESFMDMLRLNMCPQLTFFSFAVIFAIILAIMFGLQLGVDGIDTNDGAYTRVRVEFLPVDLNHPITGALKNTKIGIQDHYQVYRPLTSLFVHINMEHLFSNALMLIIWASYFEVFLSTYKTPIFFALSGSLIRYYRKLWCNCN